MASPSDRISRLRAHPIWRDVSDARARALTANATLVRLEPGQLAVREGEDARHVYLVLEGAMRVYFPLTRRRPELTVRLLSAPASFGDLACARGIPYTASVEALSPSVVLGLPASAYFDALRADPIACFRQYEDLLGRFLGSVSVERATYAGGIKERVVALLAAYARRLGRSVEGGTLIDHPLSQDDVAAQVGSNRRTVVRALAELYAAGAIERRGRRYVVLDEAKLLAAAGGEVAELE